MSLWSAATLLFLVLDPVGNVPLFASVLARVSPTKRFRVLIRELLIALGVLVVFLLVGAQTLQLLHIREPALTIAGGVILLMIAVRMIFPPEHGLFGNDDEGHPLVFPLAVPLIAGPSALATVLLFVAREPGMLLKWLLAVGMAWAASAVILLLSSPIGRFIGKRGAAAVQRLMGMVLTVIAVQMLLDGLETFLGP